MTRPQTPAQVARFLSIEDHTRAIRGLSTVLRFTMGGVLAEDTLEDGIHDQVDQGVCEITAQIDAHARVIVALELEQDRAS
jgi:hypothetical protein